MVQLDLYDVAGWVLFQLLFQFVFQLAASGGRGIDCCCCNRQHGTVESVRCCDGGKREMNKAGGFQ